MPKFRLVNGASRLALGLLLPLGPAAFGQTPTKPTAVDQSGTPTPAGLSAAGQNGTNQGQEPPDASEEQAEQFPVLAVTGIEVIHSKLKSGPVVIAVSGLTSSEGWTNGELVPLTSGNPSDHVLNLVLVAQAPTESSPPTGYAPVYAVLPLPADHPFKAIRVRSGTNSVLLKDLPGYIEAAAPVDPCSHCMGRYFVGKGDTAPAGVPADQLLRQEDLPANARVIRPNDGIGDVQRNPDRLTIVVGDDGRVVDAVWE
jgi:hypothetical protein